MEMRTCNCFIVSSHALPRKTSPIQSFCISFLEFESGRAVAFSIDISWESKSDTRHWTNPPALLTFEVSGTPVHDS
jgi:hypothetical protein